MDLTDNFVGIIDLSSNKIKCIIFKNNSDGTSELLSSSSIESQGISNCKIVNLSKASKVIRLCINEAEKKAKISLKKINVVLEQPEFLCTKLSKSRKIGGSKIQKEDIEFLLKEGKKQVMLNDKMQTIIHIFNHNYVVDSKKFVDEPIDIYADYLSHEMTFITLPTNNLKNINQAFLDCDIEIERLISSTFALGTKLLNTSQLETGSVLIDFAYEQTCIGLFRNLALIHSLTIPVGANHINKDISKVCSLTLDESEKIRDDIDFSFRDNSKVFDKNNYLKDIYFKETVFRKISKDLIFKVLEARLNEILEIIKKQIIESDIDLNSKNNICIAGEYSNLLNIQKYFSNFFNLDIKRISGGNQNLFDTFAACFGAFNLVKEGWETEAIPYNDINNKQNISFFAKLFSNF